MLSLASRVCFIAAIGLLVWAIVQMALPANATPSQMALVVEEPEQDLGEQAVGAHTIAFRVRNTAERPQHIVGMTED